MHLRLIYLGGQVLKNNQGVLGNARIVTAFLWPDLSHVSLGYHCTVMDSAWRTQAARHTPCALCWLPRAHTHVSLNAPPPPFCSQRGARTAGVRFTNRAPPKSAPQLSEQYKQFAYTSTNHRRQSNTLNVLQSKAIQRQKRRQELEFATMHSATLVFVWR